MSNSKRNNPKVEFRQIEISNCLELFASEGVVTESVKTKSKYVKLQEPVYAKHDNTEVRITSFMLGGFVKDDDKFIKASLESLDVLSTLSSNSIRLLNYGLNRMMLSSGSLSFWLDSDTVCNLLDISRRTLSNITSELSEAGLMKRYKNSSQFYINPVFFCIGSKDDYYTEAYRRGYLKPIEDQSKDVNHVFKNTNN